MKGSVVGVVNNWTGALLSCVPGSVLGMGGLSTCKSQDEILCVPKDKRRMSSADRAGVPSALLWAQLEDSLTRACPPHILWSLLRLVGGCLL